MIFDVWPSSLKTIHTHTHSPNRVNFPLVYLADAFRDIAIKQTKTEWLFPPQN